MSVAVFLLLTIALSSALAQNNCTPPILDVLFVLDSTPAVGKQNHDRIRTFVSQFVRKLTVGINHTHVGVLQFTPMARPEFYPNIYLSQQRLHNAINEVAYAPCRNVNECYGFTEKNASVTYVTELGLSSAGGNRPEIADVIIMITPG